MQFEVLHRSKKKKFLIAGCLVVVVLLAIVFSVSFAKYRVTKSMQLMTGTINFSPYDFNLVAMYLDKGGALPAGQTEVVPKIGYDLDMENSACYVGDAKDDTIAITYVPKVDGTATPASLSFDNMTKSGTKCTIHFKLKDDTQNPSVTISTSSDDTSITVNANATDNVGVYYYYYKLDNGEEIRSEDPTYKFEGLNKDQTYTISVRVVDAAGNEASANDEVTVGLRAGDVILATSKPQGQTTDWTNEGKGITYYYTGKPDNWVYFAGFYWRIIRINGDGSIRMIYQGTSANETGTGTQIQTSAFNSSYNHNKYVGYMYGSSSSDYNSTHTNTNPSTIKGILDTWYNNNIVKNGFNDYVDGNAGFCGDRRVSSGTGGGTSSTDYQPYTRISNSSPSLSCNTNDIYTTTNSSTGNKALTYPIGLISADEAMLAGIPNWNSSGNTNNYLYTGQNYWTMSPSNYNNGYAYVFCVFSGGDLLNGHVVWTVYGVRPVINLKSAIAITGSGSKTDPFKVG